MIGIYCIQNIKTNKKYIGQSIDIETRIKRHFRQLRQGIHHSIYLQRSYDLYGEQNFRSTVLEQCDIQELDNKQKYWIKFYDSHNNGYNMTDGGQGIIGWKAPDSFKRKMKEITRGQNNPNYGNHWSNEQKEKLSQKLKQSGVHKGINNSRATKVFCVETLKIFNMISQAAVYVGVTISAITHALSNPCYVCKKLHFLKYSQDLYKYISQHKTQYLIDCYKKSRGAKYYLNKSNNTFINKRELFNIIVKSNQNMTYRQINKLMQTDFQINNVQYEPL